MKSLLCSANKWVKENIRPLFCALISAPYIAVFFFNIGIIHDAQKVRCLEWAWYLKDGFSVPVKGEYAMLDGNFVKTQFPQNGYLAHSFLGKQLIGLPGDHVVVNHDGVYVNETKVASGLALAKGFYGVDESHFYREFDIKPNNFFFIGDHSHSNDSRYFGAIPEVAIVAKIIPII